MIMTKSSINYLENIKHIVLLTWQECGLIREKIIKEDGAFIK
jgi:hypothetical protein